MGYAVQRPTEYRVRGGVKGMLQRESTPVASSMSRFTPVESVYMSASKQDITDNQLKDLCRQKETYDGSLHNVGPQEFSEFLRSFGVDFEDARISRIYSNLNNGRSADFDLDRYCEKNFSVRKARSERQELEEAFKKLDKDGSGKIDRKEIRSEMKSRNIFSEEYLDAVIDEADKDKEERSLTLSS